MAGRDVCGINPFRFCLLSFVCSLHLLHAVLNPGNDYSMDSRVKIVSVTFLAWCRVLWVLFFAVCSVKFRVMNGLQYSLEMYMCCIVCGIRRLYSRRKREFCMLAQLQEQCYLRLVQSCMAWVCPQYVTEWVSQKESVFAEVGSMLDCSKLQQCFMWSCSSVYQCG